MGLARATLVTSVFCFLASPGFAQTAGESVPTNAVSSILSCRQIEEQAQRLACYDASVAALAQLQESKAIMVVSKDDVREARRGLFGFTLPRLHIFGRDDEEGSDEEAARVFAGVIKEARETPSGYIFELEEGGTWMQTENRYTGAIVRPGSKIRIRRGALGGYLASIDEGGRGFRVKRLR